MDNKYRFEETLEIDYRLYNSINEGFYRVFVELEEKKFVVRELSLGESFRKTPRFDVRLVGREKGYFSLDEAVSVAKNRLNEFMDELSTIE
jgi:hypothetical protein